MESNKKIPVCFRVNLKALFEEVLQNKGNSILRMPLQITLNTIAEIAVYAHKIGDDKLIGHFCKLGMYEFSNQYSEYYNEDATEYYIKKAESDKNIG